MNTDSGKPSQDPQVAEAWKAAEAGRLDEADRMFERACTGPSAGDAYNGRGAIAARFQSESSGAVQGAGTLETRAANPRIETLATNGVRST